MAQQQQQFVQLLSSLKEQQQQGSNTWTPAPSTGSFGGSSFTPTTANPRGLSSLADLIGRAQQLVAHQQPQRSPPSTPQTDLGHHSSEGTSATDRKSTSDGSGYPAQPAAPPNYTNPQQSFPAAATSPGEPLAICLGIIDSPLAPGSWQLTRSDCEALLSQFGRVSWLRMLCTPLGRGQSEDCCLAGLAASNEAACAAERELSGIVLPGIGRLAASAFPLAALNSVSDDATLAALVSSKLQTKSQGTLPRDLTPGNPAPPPANPMVIATALAAAMGEVGADAGAALMATEAGCAAVSAVQAEPSLMNNLQQQLRVMGGLGTPVVPPPTGRTAPAAGALASAMLGGQQQQPPPRSLQEPVSHTRQAPKRRVCRLELIDLFGYHPEFNVIEAICGPNQSNIKYVMSEANGRADIDLSGVPHNNAPVAERLHLTVTAMDEETYRTAVENLEDLLSAVCRQFTEFHKVRKPGTPTPNATFRRHEYVEGADGRLVYLGQPERPKPWGVPGVPQY